MLSETRIFTILLVFTLLTGLQAEKICIVADWDQKEESFFQKGSVFYKLRSALKKKGHELVLMEEQGNFKECDRLIVFNQPLDAITRNAVKQFEPIEKKFLYLWKPPSANINAYCPCIHKLYTKVFTWKDDLVDNQMYFKFYQPALQTPMIEERTHFKDKVLCTLYADYLQFTPRDELYMERLNMINFFETNHPEDFTFYGSSWVKKNYKTYGGIPASKTDTFDRFKFCICYEIMNNVQGYISEIIFDCFRAGCIPVYWGASNIADFIPESCFIDRRNFNSNEELYQFMKDMPKLTHKQYIKKIEDYLESDEAQKFSPDFFVEDFIEQHGFH